MARKQSTDQRKRFAGTEGPDDDSLVKAMLAGDAGALAQLMDRFDRVVRYAIFKAAASECARDPQWLDSVASATWAGFVRSLQRSPTALPSSVRAYLLQIARNQVVNVRRRDPPATVTLESEAFAEDELLKCDAEDQLEMMIRLELLDSLRACVNRLPEQDRLILSQVLAVTERRWRDAAAALQIPESTLRSRWKAVLDRLRQCLESDK